MKKINLVFVLIIILSSALIAADNTPVGSFLKIRATSVNQLYNQVAKDSNIRKLYARHFGVSEKELLNNFKNNVVLISLKQPIRVNSYYVGASGKNIYVKQKLLPKGSMVFAAKNGKPLMLWSCGNPLVTVIPKEPVKKQKEVVMQPKQDAPLIIPTKVEDFTEVIGVPPVLTEVLPIVDEIAPQVVQLPIHIPSVMPPLLGAIGGVAPILGVLASQKDTPNPVPEPSVILGMGTFLLAGLPLLKRRIK